MLHTRDISLSAQASSCRLYLWDEDRGLILQEQLARQLQKMRYTHITTCAPFYLFNSHAHARARPGNGSITVVTWTLLTWTMQGNDVVLWPTPAGFELLCAGLPA
jgi:hypothetical protein